MVRSVLHFVFVCDASCGLTFSSLAFPERKYERLRGDKVCAGLSELDERIAAYELKTSLQDKFIGLAYKYDDTGQSEGWMKSILDVAGNKSEHQQAAVALASDDGAIKAQVNASMQSLLIGVLDKVMTDSGVLQERELRCANEMDGDGPNALEPEFVVQEVWGIDCYTRRNVSICLETEFDSDSAQTFTEKWLLPAINACPVDLAHDISNACLVLEGLPFDISTSLKNDAPTTYDQWKQSLLGKALLSKVVAFGPPWLRAAARLVRVARDNLGPDFFRIHPKGHGSIVLCGRLEPNRLVTFYRGEVYPSWRWGEKTDAIAKIQEQKGLKPVLPDFFNMALERPQHDPRGYGLLFVDASRKSNYGSMLSHSCQPSCEVHVVAVNGELRLAITTIREMTIGDELTFDYNAVTESLMEYQSAVCLCGHKRCSGSFLHFATADCYQQVLNRNSPVASRLANLIKGCTKRVMADDDEKILGRHGFQTAAFGAVSVNRRKAHALDKLDTSLDSIDIVPVWLRTYVADTLRYIEYERRALPIALICNDLYDETGNVPVQESEESVEERNSSEEEMESDEAMEQSNTLSKPEPPFFYYSRMQRSYFESLLGDDDKNSLSGTEMRREVQKLAAATWESLDAEAQESWKVKALEDWEKNNTSKTKVECASKKTKKLPKKEKVKVPRAQRKSEATPEGPKRPKISFQQADAEGVSAMEQRIQQLTQTLSRIGRVLDRHRESRLRLMDRSEPSFSDEALREVIHSPLQIMPDEHVIAWMWNHEEGIIRSLLKYVETEVCVSPELRLAVQDTVAKHDILEKFGKPWQEKGIGNCFPLDPPEGRARLNEAMLELRKNLLDGIQQMASVIKKHRARERLTARKREREAEKSPAKSTTVEDTVYSVMDEMLRIVEKRFSVSSVDDSSLSPSPAVGEKTDPDDPDASLDPWLRNYNKRFKIEKAADLLLLYVKTSHFFVIKTYEVLRSSPIEVYARELGNAVPASTIDVELRKDPELARSSNGNSPTHGPSHHGGDDMKSDATEGTGAISDKNARQMCKLCQPEEIISNVVVEYQGDYVLSQLLQWYNAGIGQKPGLPDVLGCVLLPSMKGCWTVDGTTGSNSFTDRATRYQSATRRRLIAWLKDPLQRGNPWPDDLRRAFLAKDDDGMIHDATGRWLPLGSPILDFLVSGDDYNMNSTLTVLSGFHTSSERSGNALGDELLSTVDEGRPAEAVSNWVQCENPKCQKWRKVPWHVDVNMLPEQFFCKDNIWNPKSASCDAPEDVWDQATDAQIGLEDTGTLLDAIEKVKSGTRSCFKLTDFRVGGKLWYIRYEMDNHLALSLYLDAAKFDVHLEGRKSWSVGRVVELDLTGTPKCVKLRLQNRKIQEDEWINIDSPRLAPLYSKVKHPPKREKQNQTNVAKGEKFSDKAKKTPGKVSKKCSLDEYTSGEGSAVQDRSNVIHTDDSSMADVFTQDSDSEVEESLPSNSDEKVPRPTVINDYQSPSDFDDAILEDSDDNTETVTKVPSAIKHVPVTDDSSPGAVETRKVDSTAVDTSLRWKIPKKAPSKIGLLAVNESAPADVSSIQRIPRKKRVDDTEASRSDVPNPKIHSPGITQSSERRPSPRRDVDHGSLGITNNEGPGKTRSLLENSAPFRNCVAPQERGKEPTPSFIGSSTTALVGFTEPHDRGYRLGGPRRQGMSVQSPSDRVARTSGDGRIRYHGTWPVESPRMPPRSDETVATEQHPRRQLRYDDATRYSDHRYEGMGNGVPRSRFDEDRSFGPGGASRRDHDDSDTRPSNFNFLPRQGWYGHRASDHVTTASYADRRQVHDPRPDSSRDEYRGDNWREGRRHGVSAYGHNDASPSSSAWHDRTPIRHDRGGWHENDFDDFQYRPRGNEHEYDRSRLEHDYDRSRQGYEYDRTGRQVHAYDRSRQVHAYDRSRPDEHEYDRSRHEEHEYDRSRHEEHEYDRSRQEHEYDRSRRHEDRSPRHGSHRDRERSRDRSRKHRSESKKDRSLDSRDRKRSRSSGPSQDRGQTAEIHSEENVRPNGE